MRKRYGVRLGGMRLGSVTRGHYMPLLSDWLSEISVAKAQSACCDAGDLALSLHFPL